MKNEIKLTIETAKNAGAIVLGYYKSKYEIKDKGYHNPVTTADHACDKYIKETLQAAFPHYGWLSEETIDDKTRLEKSRVWIVDPLDGTKEFIEGVPNFVISIALIENHCPILGVLYNPVTKELFSATKDNGAMLNGSPIKCSAKKDPAEMVILNSRSETRRGLWSPFSDRFLELKPVGSVAYKLGLTAAGEADIFASLRPKNEWDIAAGHCLINESGGKLITSEGHKITYNNESTLITPGLVGGCHTAVDKTLKIIMNENE